LLQAQKNRIVLFGKALVQTLILKIARGKHTANDLEVSSEQAQKHSPNYCWQALQGGE